MEKKPLISVIMSVYNTNEKWLKLAVESILAQTFKDFEFIIVLDCPTDNSINIINDYRIKDDRIVVIENEKNIGLTKSLNKALKKAKGKYIARMDSDDISIKTRLEKQYGFMERNDHVDVLGSYIIKINDNKTKHQAMGYWLRNQERAKIRLLFGNVGIAHPTAFMRKSFLDLNNIKYNEEILKAQDYALWIEIIQNKGVIDIIPEILLMYRESENQISFKNRSDQIEYEKVIIEKQINRLFKITDRDLAIHQSLVDPMNDFTYDDYISYIDKLIVANSSRNLYSLKLIKREIYFIWILMLLKRKKLGYPNSFVFRLFTLKALLNIFPILYFFQYILWYLKSKLIYNIYLFNNKNELEYLISN